MPTGASSGCYCGVLWRLFLLAYVGPIGAFGVCLDIEHSSTNFDIGVWGLPDEDVRAKAAYSLGVTIQVDHDLVSDLLHSGELPMLQPKCLFVSSICILNF